MESSAYLEIRRRWSIPQSSRAKTPESSSAFPIARLPDLAEADEDVLELAHEALTGWLEVALDDGELPSRPSEARQEPGAWKGPHRSRTV